MSKTQSGFVLPRRFIAVLMAALFGLTLAVNPVAAPHADAATARVIRAHTAIRALNVTAAQAGIPYLWGGTTRRGFDCSGLTQYAYAKVGKHIPRTAQQQYNATIRVNRHYLRRGDLVFFYSGSSVHNVGFVGHMGMYAGNGYMWHAPRTGKRVSKVKIWTTHVLYGRVR